MFEFDLSDELKALLRQLGKKDRALAEAVKKKVREIVSRDAETIDGYKNLRAPLNEFKRAHVGNFVLTFKIYRERNFVFFHSLRHHDEAYKI
ncbi:MAG: addiction module toxin RelE [Candidatus Micrarchaeota archaeon]